MSLEDFTEWAVTAVNSGAEAVSRADQENPDLILLDVMMPVMDGPMTLARLRGQASTANIPVIFMTAKAQPEEVQSFLELGAAGVVTKPFDPVTLAQEIESLLEKGATSEC